MSRTLSVLLAAAAVAAGAVASASPARAQTIEPPAVPGPGGIICVTCPPDYVVSTSIRYSYGIAYRYVEVTNLGGRATSSSTASATFLLGRGIISETATVPPLGPGETRLVKRHLAFYLVAGACADTLDEVAERDETNNCLP